MKMKVSARKVIVLAIKYKGVKRILNDDYDYSDRVELTEKTKNMTYEERKEYKRNNWAQFTGFYRRNIDSFCVDILEMNLFPFQRYMLRSMAKGDFSVLICCRGLTKSYLTAVFFVASCILYPNLKCGIASGKGQQARNVIIQKIQGELIKNPNINREIIGIRTSPTNCVVDFPNGAEIRAIVLGTKNADNARSWRFNYLAVDEARLVNDKVTNEVLIPMTKTKRLGAINHAKAESGKVIFISSAYLKTSDLYKRFLSYYTKMTEGNKRFFACALNWEVGVDAGLFSLEDIEDARTDPTITKEAFYYEYGAIFVGSLGDSYFPFELTSPQRILESPELMQPRKSTSKYVITHDVAISDGRHSDNAVTHVIKIKQRVSGVYTKEVVYTKPHNGLSLTGQRDFLRELYHIHFPNTVKMVIDVRGNGQPLSVVA